MGETPGRRLVTAGGSVVDVYQQGSDAELTINPGGTGTFVTVLLGRAAANDVADWLRDCVAPAEPDEVPDAPEPSAAAEVVALFLDGQVDDAGRKLFDLDVHEINALAPKLGDLVEMVQAAGRAKRGHAERVHGESVAKLLARTGLGRLGRS